MSTSKIDTLESTLAQINQRWGTNTVHKLSTSSVVPSLSTSFSVLDKALEIGGIPRGGMTEIVATPTSGMGTLALKMVASAHAVGDMAVYMDLNQTFDPDYAVRCGVDIQNLLVVRPEPLAEAVEMAYNFIANHSAGLLVYDLSLLSPSAQRAALPLDRLLPALTHSSCAFLVLSPVRVKSPSTPLIPQAMLRLKIDRERWLKRRRDVQGYRASVTILKNKFASVPEPVQITIGFNGVVQGDGV